MCLDCLERKSGLATDQVTDVLTRLLLAFTMNVTDDVCAHCLRMTVVHRLG